MYNIVEYICLDCLFLFIGGGGGILRLGFICFVVLFGFCFVFLFVCLLLFCLLFVLFVCFVCCCFLCFWGYAWLFLLFSFLCIYVIFHISFDLKTERQNKTQMGNIQLCFNVHIYSKLL